MCVCACVYVRIFTCTGPRFYPTGLHVKSRTKRSAVVHWDPLVCCKKYGIVIGYRLFLEDLTGASEKVEIEALGQYRDSYPLNPLHPGTIYSLKIAAFNVKGVSPLSPPVQFKTKGQRKQESANFVPDVHT